MGLRLLCACASLFGVLSSDPAFAQKARETKAVVQEVDAIVGTITVVVGPGQVKTFNLSRPDLPVTDFAGKSMNLKELRPDQRVVLTTSGGEDVTAIRVAPPTLFGTLVHVDLAKRMLILKSNAEEKSITLAADAKISSSLGPASLESLKTGQSLLVAFSAEKQEAIEVKFGKIAQPPARFTKGSGTLIDIDAVKKTLDVLGTSSMSGDHAPLRHYKLTQDATCTLLYYGKAIGPLALEDAVRGVKVGYWKDPATKKIVHLQIDMPTLVRRKVKTFDASERRLVIEDLDTERTLMLTPTAELLTASGPGKLEDIRPGILVHCGLRPDRKTVEVLEVLPK